MASDTEEDSRRSGKHITHIKRKTQNQEIKKKQTKPTQEIEM